MLEIPNVDEKSDDGGNQGNEDDREAVIDVHNMQEIFKLAEANKPFNVIVLGEEELKRM